MRQLLYYHNTNLIYLKQCMLKICFFVSVLVVFLCLTAGALYAQWPKTHITLLTPYSPGGATSFQARLVTMNASDANNLGEPILIKDMPGKGGEVAWSWFMTEAPLDGHTMVTYSVPHFILHSIKRKVAYGYASFEPLANWGYDPTVLVVAKESPLNSLDKLIEFARKSNYRVRMNGSGDYNGFHLATMQLAKTANLPIIFIPENGAVPALQSIIAQKVHGGFTNLSDAYRNRALLNVLAIADMERSELFPNVPTFQEKGFIIDNSSAQWRGVALPKGTPPHIIDKAAEKFFKMFQDPEVEDIMYQCGITMKVMNRQEVILMLKERHNLYVQMMKDMESVLTK